MPRTRRASLTDPPVELSSLTTEEARALLAAALTPNPQAGILQLHGQPCVIVRPEVIVNIQKQLEQTIGASAKGLMYLAGERSSREGVVPPRAFSEGVAGPRSVDGARRIIDGFAMLGWGHAELSVFDPEKGRLSLRVVNSPVAVAYGPSKTPVCHFLAGWAGGMGRALVGREVLCEEASCRAQGREFCEFEMRPMPGS